MDAHSYLCRGGVFANAQTGNILLLGVSLSNRDLPAAFYFLCPICAFMSGIVLAELILSNLKDKTWSGEKAVLLLEVLIVSFISFLSQNHNTLANVLTSFVCGLQLDAFRDLNSITVPTTMCIGNLRGATSNFVKYCQTNDRMFLQKASVYGRIILFFVLGSVIEGKLIKVAGEKSMLFSAAILLICMLIADADKR